MNNNYKYKNYICRGKNNRLVLHDFIYEMFYMFKLSGKNNLYDFALDLVNKIATRMHIWKIYHNEINSSSLDFYIALYKYIEQNGGLKNCDKLSEYTYNINNIESFKELVNSGKIIKEEIQITDQELLSSDKINNNCKKNSISGYSIIRDSSGNLILPDELFKAFNSFDGENSYQFANHAVKVLSNKIENSNDELFRYYTAIYTLIEKEKFCYTISEFCKKKQIDNTQKAIESMFHSKQLKMYNIKMNINGSISETPIDSPANIENTVYNLDFLNTDTKKNKKEETIITQALKSYIQTEIIEVEKELQQVTNHFNIKTEAEYSTNKNALNDIRIKIKKIYKNAQEQYNDETDKNLINKTEKKYKEINTKIDKLSEKLEKLNTELKKHNDKEKKDYYEQIQSKLGKFENELTSITENMNINSEKEYISIHSKLATLRDRLHDFYKKSLKEAHQNSSLTGPLIKEATTKHNELMDNINAKMKELEELKKKLLFKNLFSG